LPARKRDQDRIVAREQQVDPDDLEDFPAKAEFRRHARFLPAGRGPLLRLPTNGVAKTIPPRPSPPDALAMDDRASDTTEAFHLQAPRITHLQ
jgi:hypothetical protein